MDLVVCMESSNPSYSTYIYMTMTAWWLDLCSWDMFEVIYGPCQWFFLFVSNDMYLSHYGQVDIAANVQPENVEHIWNLRGILNTSWHRIHIHTEHPDNWFSFYTIWCHKDRIHSQSLISVICTLSINLSNWESVYFSDRFPCVRLCWWTPEAVLFAEIGTCKDHNYAL